MDPVFAPEPSLGGRSTWPYVLAGVAVALLLVGAFIAGQAPKSADKAPTKHITKDPWPSGDPSVAGPDLVGTSTPPPWACSSKLHGKYSYQLASKRSLGDALQLRARIRQSPMYLELPGSAYIVYKKPYYVVMAGEFDRESEAASSFTDAKDILGQGGYIRPMTEYCDAIYPATEDYCTCIKH